MKITKGVIKLIIYAHENGIDLIEVEVPDQGESALTPAKPMVSVTFKERLGRAVAEGPKDHKKRGRKKQVRAWVSGGSIPDKEIVAMRAFLSAARANSKLDENQIRAIESMKGVHAHGLTVEQRGQIKSIYEDVRG